jgi:hypothetical protein
MILGLRAIAHWVFHGSLATSIADITCMGGPPGKTSVELTDVNLVNRLSPYDVRHSFRSQLNRNNRGCCDVNGTPCM